ncbi:hypothetical protein KKC88_02840 [Patescibacteria group bacterium]|nr:hypothetical protein [Patescibacteria group bacterium]MBU1672908.1 hypothetical protein [Patescibacteria group bacterium]MBU1963159.1 hypothetical protein [Patescibacteria group bacterium]
MKEKTKKAIIFVALFTVIGGIASLIPFTKIMGSDKVFNLFDFMGPISGMFIGSIYGAISVFFVKLINFFIGGEAMEISTIIRFFPMMFAAVYMGMKNNKLATVVPIICMIMFWAHPEGRQAWYFALYWLIPIFAAFGKKRLILNSLGATFTAHCVGSVAFLYAFNLPAEVWLALIPVVWIERGLMAGGIWVSYSVFNTAIDKILVKKFNWNLFAPIVNKNYTFSKKFFKSYS